MMLLDRDAAQPVSSQQSFQQPAQRSDALGPRSGLELEQIDRFHTHTRRDTDNPASAECGSPEMFEPRNGPDAPSSFAITSP
jgi:hypothetical protein